MDHINFPYRDAGHLAFMHVVAECGAWERQNLSVAYDKPIGRGDAHKLVPTGEVEFTSGNHVSTYAARARGDNWVYLGQSVSENRLSLVTRFDSGIDRIADIKGRRFGSLGRHPSLNDWLYLKQNGLDVDRNAYELIRLGRELAGDPKYHNMSLIEAVKTREVDACFLAQPRREFAAREGLKVIEIPPQPMIWFTTVSSSLPFVQKHPDIVKRVLMALLDGVAFFKTQRERTIDILLARHDREGKLDRLAATKLYDDLAPMLEPKLYPSLASIFNVYEEAKRQSKDAQRIHALALWDFHFLREIDDSRYIEELYGRYSIQPPS